MRTHASLLRIRATRAKMAEGRQITNRKGRTLPPSTDPNLCPNAVGRYEFVVERDRYSANPTEGGIALPLDERFWSELLRNKTGAIRGLVGVEIDWM